MNKVDFVQKYYQFAVNAEKKTKVPAIFTLAQCAVESAWGEKAVGFNFFGIKDTDGINGNEQLITTTEYLKSQNVKFPMVLSKVFIPAKNLWKYIVKTYFRKYNTPEESFVDHAMFFILNKRYEDNFATCGTMWKCWCIEAAKDGYATDPNYADTLISVGKGIEQVIKQLNP